MKRRNFIITIGSALSFFIPAATKIANASSNVIVWVKENTLGYKKKASKEKVAQGKICLSCSWYSDDPKNDFGGECKLKAIQNAMKSPKVMAHSAGNCNMWQKRS